MDFRDVSQLWDLAVEHWEAGDHQEAYCCFDRIPDPPIAIVFNAAVLELMYEEYDDAHENFSYVLDHDSNLAAAYFLRGVTSYRLKNYRDARDDFQATLKNMDDRSYINYAPLGMKLVLCEFQVLANLGMVSICSDSDTEAGLRHMVHAITKQDILTRDKGIQAQLARSCCAIADTPVPFFEDVVKDCQSGDCPLLVPEPLPYFRNDGLLLSNFRHQHEMSSALEQSDECDSNDSAQPTSGSPSNENKNRKWLIQRTTKKLKASKTFFCRRSSKLLDRGSRSFSMDRGLSPSVIHPERSRSPSVSAPNLRPNSPFTGKPSPRAPLGYAHLASSMDDVRERSGSRSSKRRSMSGSYTPTGDVAATLLSTSRSSLTDVGDDGITGSSTRRVSMTRRRSRSATPAELTDHLNGDVPEYSRQASTSGMRPMSLGLSRNICGSLPDIAGAHRGRDSPLGPPSPSPLVRHPMKVSSPLLQSRFTFKDLPATNSQTPSTLAQPMVLVKSDPSKRIAPQSMSQTGRSASFAFENGLGSTSPSSGVDSGHESNESVTGIQFTVGDSDEESHSDREDTCGQDMQESGQQTSQDKEEEKEKEKEKLTTQTTLTSLTPSTDSAGSEQSGFASDGSSVGVVDLSKLTANHHPCRSKITCKMDDVVDRVTSMGSNMKGLTINIIVRSN